MATDIAPGDLTPEQLDTLARAAHEAARTYWRTYWLANGRRGMKDFDIGPIEDVTERSRAALDAALLAVVRGVRALDAASHASPTPPKEHPMPREHLSTERLSEINETLDALTIGLRTPAEYAACELRAELRLVLAERDAFTGRHMIYDIYDGSEIECLCGKHFGRLNFTDSMRDYREHVLASVAGQ